jgi:hypothetical protein
VKSGPSQAVLVSQKVIFDGIVNAPIDGGQLYISADSLEDAKKKANLFVVPGENRL